MKTIPLITLITTLGLSLAGCDRKADRVVVVKPVSPGVPLVVPQNPTVPVVVEAPPKNAPAVIVEKEAPAAYYETYVDGQPAPAARVEVVPTSPGPNAVWVAGRWVRERNEHAETDGTVSGQRWAWTPGYWKLN